MKPGDISGTITIQLQDAGGTAAQAAETIDVEFLSNSPTGEFLSPTSENPATKTISTGSANKNFRYRDSSLGSFTLTINAKGRTSGTTWSASQNATISNNTASGTAATTTPNDNSTESTSASGASSDNSTSGTSAHYISSGVSSKKPEVLISLNAGRDRIGSVGSPLEFKADTSLSYSRNVEFKWNFGDGIEAGGEMLSHTYLYPGEYVVVLNVISPEGRAVSRTNVKIIEPEISIVSADFNRIEVRNNSKQEVSLYGRALYAKQNSFVFPQDTIIKAGQSISFAGSVTGLHPSLITDATLMVIGNVEHSRIREKIEEVKIQKVTALQTEIEALKAQLAQINAPDIPANYSKLDQTILAPKESMIDSKKIETASALNGIATSTEKVAKGWLKTLKSFFLRK